MTSGDPWLGAKFHGLVLENSKDPFRKVETVEHYFMARAVNYWDPMISDLQILTFTFKNFCCFDLDAKTILDFY